MRCCATCRGHRLPRWRRSRFPANGAAPRGGPVSEGKSAGVGRAGGLRRGRCKYVHVSSVAASMRLTPLRSPPARPRTVSVCVHHGKEREDQKRIASLRIHAWRGSTVSTKVDTHRQSQLTHRHRELSGVGRCGAAGPLAPWMAPSSPQGRVYGVSCSPTPPRPTLSNPEPLLLLLLLLPLQVQGCKPCKSHYVTQPAITSRARIASHSSSIRHTRLIASRRSGSRCHTGNSPASV